MQKRHFAFVFFILLFSFQAAAQPFSIRHLGIEDGLSNNYVVDIEQDGKGCVWIATEAGLNHFDGQSFTVYRTSNSKLASNELNTLLYDRENNKLWIGTQRDGISVLDCATREIENFTNEDVLATNDVTHFSPAAAGGIWITHYHVGITHYDRKTGRFTHFMDAEIENMKSTKWCSHDDGAGNLYVGHARDGLSIIDLKTKTARNFRHEPGNPKSLPGNDVRAICIDRQHNVWIGTDEGLALFNPQTETFICFSHDAGNPHSLIADPVYDICETGNGKLWIATGAGGISILDLRSITLVNPEAVKFHNIAPAGDPEELSSGNIRTLFQDSFGNVWIGNYGAGLDVLNNSLPVFQTIYYTTDKKGKQKNRPVWGICADGKGQVFLGSENEIAVLEDGLLKRTINLSAHLSGPFVQVCAVEQDRQGILWLGVSNEGILKFNLSNGKFEQVRLDINNLGFITFFEDADDKMWIGTLNGLYSFKDGKLGKEDSINSQLTDKIIYSMLRDGQGKLWVGTFGKGISIFDKADRLVARFETDSGFCSNAINHLYMDTGGGIWAATRNGLVYFDDTGKPGHYRLYNEEQGLVDVYIRAIQEDKNGNIWISSNGSISMWDREKQRFNNYDCRDGIPMGNFVEGSACTTPDGTIYFGSTNGVCRFRPSEFVLQRQVAPVQIIECRSLDRGIKSQEDGLLIPAGNGRIELPYGQNSFRISFSSPDFAHSGQVEYAYMIDGLASEWSNTYGDNQVTFRNLSPGEYTFRVKARLRNQAWDESHAASLSVRIHPPFWLTWYAKTCYALLLCMALLAIIRFYKYRLNLESSLEIERKESQNRQELNDERLRFYTNITHELRTPLTLILGPLEDLLNDRDLPAHYNRQIKIIHGSAVRLLNLINQILDFRKTETQNRRLTVAKGDLGCLVTETGLRYKELNRNDKVKFHIAVETEETVMYFDADVITTILSNLLSNAVKYTPEGEIRLALSSASEYTEIRVSDTGYGISEQDLPHIFERYFQAKGKHQASGTGIGLALVKSLADLHHGTLHVESREGEGTTFRFRILTENTYPHALRREAKKPLSVQETDKTEDDANSRPQILVVEDSDDIREYIATSFASHCKVMTAINGRDGLELARKHIPNIIVSDIMMPVMDGMEFCRAVKEDIRTSHIPVILLTAKDSIQDKEEGYESGADSYLTKPFSAKLLRSRVQNLLESRRKLAQQITEGAKKIKPDKGEESLKLSKLDEDFLTRLTALVEGNMDSENLDIAFIVDKIGMSHSTFYRKVKGLTGVSANEFIRKVRLKHSLQLLLSGTCNVSEAAYKTGFNDLGYFRECFREEYGMTPSEYLKTK